MECSAFLLLWRRWIRFAVVVIYIVLLVIAIPLCIWELERNGAPGHVQAWFIGGMFVLMALPISFWGILQHILNYTTPHLQRYIIRILWMVPIYALNAWFALRFPDAAIYLDTLRECYEAYVIYNVMAYLLSFLNHDYPHLDIQTENKPPVRHIFPLCLLPPCQYSPKFIQHCKHGVLQYTVVRPAMTVIALICEMFDKYSEGDFNFKSAWSYIVIINNLSQILAMYCLVLFYKAFKEELQPLKPIPKLLCVKAVVFLSFWQSLLIAALAKVGVIPEHSTWVVYKNVKAVATGLQDFIICIEMFVAAIAHYFSFSHKPFINLAMEQQNCCASFLSMWNIRDVTEDVVEHARYIGRGMHKTLSKGRRLVQGGNSERTPLLADSQDSGQHVSTQSTFQNSQAGSTLKSSALDDDDVISSGGDSMYGRRYDTFVNKSTTSSMLNYADFTSDTSWQQESKSNLSASVSLRGYDSSGDELDRDSLQKKKREPNEVKIIAEIGIDEARCKNVRGNEIVQHVDVHGDETFHHLDVCEDEIVALLDVRGDETDHLLDVRGDETDHLLDLHGDETSHHLDVHEHETSHQSNDEDKTAHLLNVHGDETSQHLDVHEDEKCHQLNDEDKTAHHLHVHEDETAHHLDVHEDETAHHLDVHEDETAHHLDVHEDETAHHLAFHKEETTHSLDIHEDDHGSGHIQLNSISNIAVDDMHNDSLERLSAETSAHSDSFHGSILQESTEDEQISSDIFQVIMLQTSGHNSSSEGQIIGSGDIIHDFDQSSPVV